MIQSKSFLAILIFVLTFSFSFALKAEEIRLQTSMDLLVDHRGALEYVATLPANAIIILDTNDRLSPRSYERSDGRMEYSNIGWVGVSHIINNSRGRHDRDLDYAAYRVNNPVRGEYFYISERVFHRGRNYTPAPAPVVIDHFHNDYEVCYERPRTHWVTLKEEQARRGRRNAVVGAGAMIIGTIIGGGSGGNSDLGNLITIGGAAIATIGLVQISNAQGPVTVYDQRCDRFYTRDTRVRRHRIDNRSCTTERYYSRNWGSEVEYFRTTCSGQVYFSFERNHHYWY